MVIAAIIGVVLVCEVLHHHYLCGIEYQRDHGRET